MNVLVFALLIAGAAAQWAYPGHYNYGVYPYAAHTGYVTPYAAHTGYVAPYAYVNKEAIKTEWDDKDGSPKTPVAVKEWEKKAEEYKKDWEKKVEFEKKAWEKSAFVGTPYTGYPAVYHPFASTWAYPGAYEVKNFEKKEETKRTRRGLADAAFPTPLHRDFAYSSTDLNQDGQPDSKQFYPTPYAYGAYPYSYGAYPYNSYYTPKYFY
jgi:hypothetical protein